MLKDYNKILFATDLSEYCADAYEVALGLYIKLCSGITLLHVIENNPVSIDIELRSLLGEERYENMIKKSENDTRSLLIGKRSHSEVVKSAIHTMCENTRNNHLQCLHYPDEILVRKGNIAEAILSTSMESESDMILMGLHKNIFAKGLVSKVVRDVLRKSKIPVLLIPPKENS